jgi:hypothetical protein
MKAVWYVVLLRHDIILHFYKHIGLGYLFGNSDLNVNTALNVEGGDLLDNLWRREEVDSALVDSHFVSVPGLRTLTVRSLSGCDLEDLGWQSNGTLGLESGGLSTVDNVVRD